LRAVENYVEVGEESLYILLDRNSDWRNVSRETLRRVDQRMPAGVTTAV
jgi:hypothetical protein